MVVALAAGDVDAYAPAAGEAPTKYTVEADVAPAMLKVRARANALVVCAPGCAPAESQRPVNVLIRVPHGVRAVLSSRTGTVTATDVNGPVEAETVDGDIRIQVPSYADAHAVRGNVSVTFGDAEWPGTLHIRADRGDATVYVPATANGRLDLHTEAGTIFTDFNLRGTSQGSSETIVGPIGAGGNRTVEVRVGYGNIRVLRLTPQM